MSRKQTVKVIGTFLICIPASAFVVLAAGGALGWAALSLLAAILVMLIVAEVESR